MLDDYCQLLDGFRHCFMLERMSALDLKHISVLLPSLPNYYIERCKRVWWVDLVRLQKMLTQLFSHSPLSMGWGRKQN